jgi:hypothetical protein
MKILITGSRSITDPHLVPEAVEASGWKPTHVVTQGESSTAAFAERWAASRDVPFGPMPMDLRRYKREAETLQNRALLEAVDAAIVLWDGVSPGTSRLIDEARRMGKPIYVHRV